MLVKDASPKKTKKKMSVTAKVFILFLLVSFSESFMAGHVFSTYGLSSYLPKPALNPGYYFNSYNLRKKNQCLHKPILGMLSLKFAFSFYRFFHRWLGNTDKNWNHEAPYCWVYRHTRTNNLIRVTERLKGRRKPHSVPSFYGQKYFKS